MVSASAQPLFGRTKPSYSVIVGPASHTATIVLHGEVDLACADTVRAMLDEQFAAGRRHVRVDTAAVRFIDSTVLGVIADGHDEMLRRGGTLVVTGASRRLQRLLRITALDRVLFLTDPQPRRSVPSARAGARRRSRLRALRPAVPSSG